MQKAADTVIVSAVFLVPEIIVKISQEYRKLTRPDAEFIIFP